VYIFHSLSWAPSTAEMRLSWALVAVGHLVSNVLAYDPTDSLMDGGLSTLPYSHENIN
jgi:hypothetical protein